MGLEDNKYAIITGVTGQDGALLAEFLLDKGYFVVGLKRRTSIINTERVDDFYHHPKFKLEYYDLNDVGRIYSILTKYPAREFYHLAAMSHVKVSFEIPEHTVDGIAMGTTRILEAIRQVSPTTRFYNAATSEMYGNALMPKRGYNEEGPFWPVSPYACAKLFGHNMTRVYREGYGLHASSGILFNHEDMSRGETFVTRKITMGAASIKVGLQDKLILGNLESKRDWGYALDYVEAMWLMLQQHSPDDYVVATGKSISVKDFLKLVFDYAGLDWKKYVRIGSKYYRPNEVHELKGDATKAKEILGWESRVGVEKMAKMMYDYDLMTIEGRDGKRK